VSPRPSVRSHGLAFGPDLAILGLPGEFFRETAEAVVKREALAMLAEAMGG